MKRVAATLLAGSALLVAAAAPSPAGSRAARFLAAEGHRLHSEKLTSLAQEAATPGGMDKVKELINHMLAQKLSAQAQDTDHQGFCNTQTAQTKKKLETQKRELDKQKADLDEDTAKLAELKQNIADTQEELTKAHKSGIEAAKLRQKENEKYLANKAEYDRTEDAMAKAAGKMELDGGPEASVQARKATEDAIKRRVDEESKEQRRAFEYKRLSEELEVSKAKKTQEVENMERDVVRLQRDLSQKENDLSESKTELAAVQDYSEHLKSQCTVKVDSHKERAARRNQELDSLKDAYSILNGESFPVL